MRSASICMEITVSLTTRPLFQLSGQNEEISHLLMLLKTAEVSQHAMLQKSMEPSMVLDRTMFNLYCSTTWLDQAQRKTPSTARVSVRQPPKREERWEEAAWRSTSWRFHCELQSTSPCIKEPEFKKSIFITTNAQKHLVAQHVSALEHPPEDVTTSIMEEIQSKPYNGKPSLCSTH